ncbi:hypothetical protein J2Y58_003199, partial [Sphingomonas sp. BE138]|uniref:hypothetical protein n=1 Tax=Sphingomonas sp. BE138 TaxID=2817845 RepID=UPI00285F16E8
MSRRPAPFPQATSISLFAGVARALTHDRRVRAKKVSSNRLTDVVGIRRGRVTAAVLLFRSGCSGRHMDGQR